MRMRGRKRLLPLLLSVGFSFLAVATVWLWVRRDQPPVQQLLETRLYYNLALENAREEEAGSILLSVQENLNRAQGALDSQYRRLVLFRNYDLARYHVHRARSLCNDALSTARQARQDAVVDCQRRLAMLQRSLNTSRSLLERLAVKDGALVKLISAENRLRVADSRLADHQTREVREILNEAEGEIADASVMLQGHLTEFLTRRQQWNTWIRQTLDLSARMDQPVVLVDKLNHECYLLRRGRVVDSYPVELGGMWTSPKIREGDRATPEGCYRVSALNGSSRFYRAALLNYPTEADRSRFVRAKRAGQLPRSARIGGMIEIHGEGGRGADWTAGCISLTNRDLDRLFRQLRVGTPVTIVGLWQEPSWLKRVGTLPEDMGSAENSD